MDDQSVRRLPIENVKFFKETKFLTSEGLYIKYSLRTGSTDSKSTFYVL